MIGRFGGSLCASSGTPSQPQTLWRWSQGNVERMTQKEVLNFKLAPRIEQISDKCSKHVNDCEHRMMV